MIVVTAGREFTDIDAFACAVAYAELLGLEGKESVAVLPGQLNSSVPEAVRAWKPDYEVRVPAGNNPAVLVDISEVAWAAEFVRPEDVIEVYDHRHGFQDYWAARPRTRAKIELVGACATLIWEEYQARGRADQISPLSAKLLQTAILSNTLNFKAAVTVERDQAAYRELGALSGLPDDWPARYFKGVEEHISRDVAAAIRHDTKDITRPGRAIVVGQLELWEGAGFLDNHSPVVEGVLSAYGNPSWAMSVLSISEGKNYLYCREPATRELLTRVMGATWEGERGVTSRLWLRKEIRKAIFALFPA